MFRHRFASLVAAACLAALLSPAPGVAQTQPAPASPVPAADTAPELHFLPASPPVTPDDLLAKIRRRGVLQVGVSNIMPWAMHDRDGKLVGFEVDLLGKLAEDLGVKTAFVPVPHGEAIADLLSGRFDLILNRMSITPQRALVVAFSEPLVVSSVELVANRQKAGARKSAAEFKSADVTIGIHKGTETAELVRRSFPKARLEEFDDDMERFEALRTGRITAAVGLTAAPGVLSSRYPKEISSPLAAPLSRRAQAFAVRPSDADFLHYLNAWITAHSLDGFIPGKVDSWFREMAWTADM